MLTATADPAGRTTRYGYYADDALKTLTDQNAKLCAVRAGRRTPVVETNRTAATQTRYRWGLATAATTPSIFCFAYRSCSDISA